MSRIGKPPSKLVDSRTCIGGATEMNERIDLDELTLLREFAAREPAACSSASARAAAGSDPTRDELRAATSIPSRLRPPWACSRAVRRVLLPRPARRRTTRWRPRCWAAPPPGKTRVPSRGGRAKASRGCGRHGLRWRSARRGSWAKPHVRLEPARGRRSRGAIGVAGRCARFLVASTGACAGAVSPSMASLRGTSSESGPLACRP